MKIQFEIDQKIYDKALRYTADPVQHLQTVLDGWAQLAEQKHPGVDVLTLPTMVQKDKQLEAERAVIAKKDEAENVQRKLVEVKKQAEQQAVADAQAKANELQQAAAIEARAFEMAKIMAQSLLAQGKA